MKKIILLFFTFGLLVSPVTSIAQSDLSTPDREAMVAQIALLQKLIAQLVALQNSTSDSIVTRVSPWNPTQQINTSCVSSEKTGYIVCFGGRGKDTGSKNITLYDISTNRPGFYPETIPYTYASSCATDSNKNLIYCFGGYALNTFGKFVPSNDIWTLELGKQNIESVNNSMELPFNVSGMSCVESVHNQTIYCFGGYISDSEVDGVRTYKNYGGQLFSGGVVTLDLRTKKIGLIKGSTEIAGDDMACTYDRKGEKIYCFGGDVGSFRGAETDKIFSFDPKTERITVLNTNLPMALAVSSCISHPNGMIYCLGGTSIKELGVSDNQNSDIYTFNPKSQKITTIKNALVKPLAGHSCALDPVTNDDIYCFGGSVETASGVYKFTP